MLVFWKFFLLLRLIFHIEKLTSSFLVVHSSFYQMQCIYALIILKVVVMSRKSQQASEKKFPLIQNAFGLRKTTFQEIDDRLAKSNLYQLHHFHYSLGDCLFYSMVALLNFRYTSLEIRQAIIDHFQFCLQHNHESMFLSIRAELIPGFLESMHGVTNIDTYLDLMFIFYSPSHRSLAIGLSGDPFCIKWFSLWQSARVTLWLLSIQYLYLCFNEE